MSDKTCKTCKWWREHNGILEDGMCHRSPLNLAHNEDDWCGEWTEAEVTDEQTLVTGFGTPAFKVTERENGTSTTEPIDNETSGERDRLKDENAKLRELLRDTLIHPDQYCDKYGIEYEDGADTWDKANADIDRRLRELGVVE